MKHPVDRSRITRVHTHFSFESKSTFVCLRTVAGSGKDFMRTLDRIEFYCFRNVLSRKSCRVHDRSFIRLFPLELIAISRLLFLLTGKEMLQRVSVISLLLKMHDKTSSGRGLRRRNVCDFLGLEIVDGICFQVFIFTDIWKQ